MSDSLSPALGIILVNLGTPEQPNRRYVRRYLAEFLSDPRVVHVPRFIWWIILQGIILRLRPGPVAKLYQSIWTPQGSPLLAIGRKQQHAIREELQRLGSPLPVELAMTYGQPSMRQALQALAQQAVQRVLVLPLFPQYSATTTAAVFDALSRALGNSPNLPEILFIRDYWQRPDYIAALAASVKDYWQTQGQPSKLLMSFHGIPKRYEAEGDPYPDYCRATAQALASELEISPEQWSVSFQSRLGKAEWVQPYTDKVLQQWGADPAIERVDVICPAFAADCLETLEEIQVENKELFIAAGGKDFHYIPCLNERPDHIRMLCNLILERSQGWRLKE